MSTDTAKASQTATMDDFVLALQATYCGEGECHVQDSTIRVKVSSAVCIEFRVLKAEEVDQDEQDPDTAEAEAVLLLDTASLRVTSVDHDGAAACTELCAIAESVIADSRARWRAEAEEIDGSPPGVTDANNVFELLDEVTRAVSAAAAASEDVYGGAETEAHPSGAVAMAGQQLAGADQTHQAQVSDAEPPNTSDAPRQLQESKEENQTQQNERHRAIVFFDHMNDAVSYTKNIESLCAESSLTVLAATCASADAVHAATGKRSVKRCYLVLEHSHRHTTTTSSSSSESAFQTFFKGLRQRNMDVDSRGKPCKERKAEVVVPPFRFVEHEQESGGSKSASASKKAQDKRGKKVKGGNKRGDGNGPASDAQTPRTQAIGSIEFELLTPEVEGAAAPQVWNARVQDAAQAWMARFTSSSSVSDARPQNDSSTLLDRYAPFLEWSVDSDADRSASAAGSDKKTDKKNGKKSGAGKAGAGKSGKDAVQSHDKSAPATPVSSLTIAVRVTPNKPSTAFRICPDTGLLLGDIAAPPREGAANEEVLRAFGGKELLGGLKNVSLSLTPASAKSRDKAVVVTRSLEGRQDVVPNLAFAVAERIAAYFGSSEQ